MKISKAAVTISAATGLAAVIVAGLAMTGHLAPEQMIDALAVSAAVGIVGFISLLLIKKIR